ncbi:MAG: ABC transporter permease [Candidatus Dormibacteraceae bacterium]
MLNIIVRRVLIGIPVIIGASVLIFVVLHVLPGDPIAALTAGAPTTPGEIANLRRQYGLDNPLPEQFLSFFWNALHGNLGTSYSNNQPVLSMILSQAPATFALTLAAMVLTVVFGIGLGVLSAIFRNTWIDAVIRVLSLLGTAMPIFWTGILLLLVFSFTFHLFPATGNTGISSLILPAVSLAFLASGLVIRLVRNSMIEVFGENFVLALYAKGLTQQVVILKHVLRNALIPAITIIGLQVGALLSGAVITETVFSRQGIGQLLITGIENKDYPLIQGTMLFIAVVYVVINIIVDVSYGYVDPRVRATITQGR